MRMKWRRSALTLRPFGERAYLVRAVPLMAAGDDWAGMLRELLDALSGEDPEQVGRENRCFGGMPRRGQGGAGSKRRRDAGAGKAAGANGQPADVPPRPPHDNSPHQSANGKGFRAGVNSRHCESSFSRRGVAISIICIWLTLLLRLPHRYKSFQSILLQTVPVFAALFSLVFLRLP